MGKTEGPGRTHLNCKVPFDVKNKVVDAVDVKEEAASHSDYVSRCILYYHDERPIMRELIESLLERVNHDNLAILQKLENIENRMAKAESQEGKSS